MARSHPRPPEANRPGWKPRKEVINAVRFAFGILGPLEVLADGERIAVGGPRQRVLLAMLLLPRNRIVSIDRPTEAAWNGKVAALRCRPAEGGPACVCVEQEKGAADL